MQLVPERRERRCGFDGEEVVGEEEREEEEEEVESEQ